MCRPVSGSWEKDVPRRTHRSAPTRGGKRPGGQRDRCKTRPSSPEKRKKAPAGGSPRGSWGSFWGEDQPSALGASAAAFSAAALAAAAAFSAWAFLMALYFSFSSAVAMGRMASLGQTLVQSLQPTHLA